MPDSLQISSTQHTRWLSCSRSTMSWSPRKRSYIHTHNEVRSQTTNKVRSADSWGRKGAYNCQRALELHRRRGRGLRRAIRAHSPPDLVGLDVRGSRQGRQLAALVGRLQRTPIREARWGQHDRFDGRGARQLAHVHHVRRRRLERRLERRLLEWLRAIRVHRRRRRRLRRRRRRRQRQRRRRWGCEREGGRVGERLQTRPSIRVQRGWQKPVDVAAGGVALAANEESAAQSARIKFFKTRTTCV